jgi:hypothetical protein
MKKHLNKILSLLILTTVSALSITACQSVKPNATSSSTQTTSASTTTPSNTTATSSGSVEGLTLSLSLDSTTYQPGQVVTITIDEKNTLPTTNNVPTSDKWPLSSLGVGPCGPINYPFGIAVFQGGFTSSNVLSATPLKLYDPTAMYNCPAMLSGISTYAFEPSGDTAAIFQNSGTSPVTTDNMNSEVQPTGYWVANPNETLIDFDPGVYTVVGGDEWGDLAVIHFTVAETPLTTTALKSTTTSLDSMTTTGDATNPPPFIIVVTPAPPSSDTTLAYQPPPLTSPPQFTIIKAAITLGNGQAGTNIPLGSTIYHWNNKITEVIGPDDSLIFICKDVDATQIGTPGAGLQPVTQILQVPNGAQVIPDKDNKNITQIFTGNELIGTIIDKPEDFPYTPTQVRNTDQQYIATATYANGSTSDITSQVTWDSSSTQVATISSTGLVTALANGDTNITASLDGITSLSVDLTVHSLSSISLVTWNGVGIPLPFNNQPIGSTWQLKANGTYSDGSNDDISAQVTWNSSDAAVATISANGLVTNITPGTTEITASLNGITSPAISWGVVASSPVSTTSP